MTANDLAWGIGLSTFSADGSTLDTWFPTAQLGKADEDYETHATYEALLKAASSDPLRETSQQVVFRQINLSQKPLDAADVYLRLHLLSLRLVKPNELNLEGIFGLLNTVVWTSEGPCAVENFELTRLKLTIANRRPTVYSIDKFPRMVDYVVPSAVRIGDADRVRLGAYLAEGTTVMHEGFVNFNAGTLGTSMVEGRISQGVIVEDGSDIGGGASTMGTLSGGGTERVKIGKRSLVGAEAGVGISLGDDCVVEAGLYLTAGTKVNFINNGQTSQVKARELSGVNNLLFRRNSLTGTVEALAKDGKKVELNSELHAN